MRRAPEAHRDARGQGAERARRVSRARVRACARARVEQALCVPGGLRGDVRRAVRVEAGERYGGSARQGGRGGHQRRAARPRSVCAHAWAGRASRRRGAQRDGACACAWAGREWGACAGADEEQGRRGGELLCSVRGGKEREKEERRRMKRKWKKEKEKGKGKRKRKRKGGERERERRGRWRDLRRDRGARSGTRGVGHARAVRRVTRVKGEQGKGPGFGNQTLGTGKHSEKKGSGSRRVLSSTMKRNF